MAIYLLNFQNALTMTKVLEPLWNQDLAFHRLPEKVIALPTKAGYELIVKNEILYCRAEGNYTFIYSINGGKTIISKKMKETAECLTGGWFMRIHQSYLVNLKYAKRYERRNGGRLILSNNVVIPVSKNQKEKLLSLFNVIR